MILHHSVQLSSCSVASSWSSPYVNLQVLWHCINSPRPVNACSSKSNMDHVTCFHRHVHIHSTPRFMFLTAVWAWLAMFFVLQCSSQLPKFTVAQCHHLEAP